MSNKFNILKYYLKFRYRKIYTKRQLGFFQKSMINSHLSFVTEKSPFYRRFKGRMLESIPIIDKKIMMDNFDIINTVGINKDEAMEFAVKSERKRSFSSKLHNITVGLSSGTSHSRGIFLVEDSEKDKWAGFVLARFLERGITAKYNVAFFMRANSNLYESVGSSNIHFEFFDIYSDLQENIDKLRSFDADIIVAQPSMLLILARETEKGRLKIHPETVISIAEVLEKEDEQILKKAFGLKVIHQVYQCTECSIEITSHCDTLHIKKDIKYIKK